MKSELVDRSGEASDIQRLFEVLELGISELTSRDAGDMNGEDTVRIKATFVSLQRAFGLSTRAARRYNDRENVRKRALLLQDQLSALLNDRLRMGGDAENLFAQTLDNAKSLADNLSLAFPIDVLATTVRTEMDQEEPGRQREVFLVNFCYEILTRADQYLHFTEIARGPSTIERAIEFPPEYFSAGMMVLNEFATIIRERHGEKGARVRIHQDDLRVRLIIETADAKEEIERTLDYYGDVIKGERDISSFANSAIERVRLEGALELAQARLNAELRITNVLEAEVRVRGEQLAHVTRLLAGALASNQELASHHHDIAVAALDALSVDRYSRVLAEVARAALDHVEGDDRDELAAIAEEAGASCDSEDLHGVDSRLRRLLRRLAINSPAFIQALSSSIAVGVLSNEAAAWIDALLRNSL